MSGKRNIGDNQSRLGKYIPSSYTQILGPESSTLNIKIS